MEYQASRYERTYKENSGERIWEFLTRNDNLIRLDTATYLTRPAVEAIGPLLTAEFPSEVQIDRVKQMIGHMVRQIMEGRGYRLDRNNVRIRAENNPFTNASRYIK